MYINGDEVALANNGAQPITSALGASSSAFVLGSRGSGDYPFKGALDDFRIWNRALAQNEIRLNMVNPVVPAEQTGLVSAYSFNQGLAGMDNAGVTTLTDETGYRCGSLNGFALSGASSNWVASGAGEGLVSYTVTYDSNGATSGTAPADTLKYVSGAQVVVKGVADLAKTGCTFSGWNTQANGSGTAYTVGVALNIETSNIILYAQWTPNQSITTGGPLQRKAQKQLTPRLRPSLWMVLNNKGGNIFMKKIYEKPVIEIEIFEIEDIITSSGLTPGGDGTGDELGWGEIK